MVCQNYGLNAGRLSQNDGNRENDAKNKGLSAGLAEITATTDMMKTTGIRVQTTGSPNNEKYLSLGCCFAPPSVRNFQGRSICVTFFLLFLEKLVSLHQMLVNLIQF